MPLFLFFIFWTIQLGLYTPDTPKANPCRDHTSRTYASSLQNLYCWLSKLTPPGIGNGLAVGEAGMELEEKLFSGVVSVVWGKGK